MIQLIPHRTKPVSDLDNKYERDPIIPSLGFWLLVVSVLLFVYATCGGGDTWY